MRAGVPTYPRNRRVAGRFASRLVLAAALLGVFGASNACLSLSHLDDLPLSQKELPDFGASLAFPSEWSIRRGSFFHLESRSVNPPELRALFEYRGLEKIKKDRESKRQYAAGWYRAIALSYEGWRYDLKETDGSDPEGTFRFEGTYVDEPGGAEPIQLRKIGILRFRGARLHALYYTAPDSEFERLRPLFERMDRQHRFFTPIP